MTPEHTKQQLQDQLRSGELYGLNLVTNLHERTRKLIFKNDQHCQRCDTSPAVETPSMTAYQWDGKGEDPNAPWCCVFNVLQSTRRLWKINGIPITAASCEVMMPKFKVGQPVCWESQSNGTYATKYGMVVEVVPNGSLPSKELRPRGCGLMCRAVESYVVRTTRVVRGDSVNRESRLYWPRTAYLASWRVSAHDVLSLVEAKMAIAQQLDEQSCLNAWIADLQSGLYVNCVYCGHRYGPREFTSDTSAQHKLEKHIEGCPKHPLSQLRRHANRMAASVLKESQEVREIRSMLKEELLTASAPGGVCRRRHVFYLAMHILDQLAIAADTLGRLADGLKDQK